MTRFIHLTDLHLSVPGVEDPLLHADTAAALDLAIDRIKLLEPRLDFIAISGDLANHGRPESYAHLKNALARLSVPVIMSLGNHDDRSNFRAAFDMEGHAEAPCFHHAPVGGVHVIALDSSVPGRIGGAIGADQFAALEEALKAHPDLPKLILCHHPPLLDYGPTLVWESLSAEDTDRLAATLKGQRIAAILSGHVHHNRVTFWHGIPVIVTNGLHATVDLLAPEGMTILAGTGFAICDLTASGMNVTYVPLTPQQHQLARLSDEKVRSFR